LGGALRGRGRGWAGKRRERGGKGREEEREGPQITVEPGPLKALLRHWKNTENVGAHWHFDFSRRFFAFQQYGRQSCSSSDAIGGPAKLSAMHRKLDRRDRS